jgi:hypothetical protein
MSGEQASGRGYRPRTQVPVSPAVGAAGSGCLVGIGAVVLVALGVRACDAWRDTTSCGGPGLLMLVAIVVALVLLGSVLLAYVHVPHPVLVSLLGVTLAALTILFGFVEDTSSVWMWLVMPLLGAGSFALGHLVLSTAAKPEDDYS